jgi:hypothetical protein
LNGGGGSSGNIFIGNASLRYYNDTGIGRLAVPSGKTLNLAIGTTDVVQVSGTGNVGIGKAPTGIALDVNGQVNANSLTTGVIQASDTIRATGDLIITRATYPGVKFQTSTSPTAGCGSIFWDSVNSRLCLESSILPDENNAPIYIKGSQVETAGNLTVKGASFNVVNDSYPGMNVKTATTGREGYVFFNTATDKLTLATVSNTYPIRLEGSQVEVGNLFSSGNLQGRSVYTSTALTGTVSQNGYGALFFPLETGAYLFSAYLTSAPSTANIAGMIFAVNGTITRISTQFATLMTATGTNETSLLIQNLSATASQMRISVQRFGL